MAEIKSHFGIYTKKKRKVMTRNSHDEFKSVRIENPTKERSAKQVEVAAKFNIIPETAKAKKIILKWERTSTRRRGRRKEFWRQGKRLISTGIGGTTKVRPSDLGPVRMCMGTQDHRYERVKISQRKSTVMVVRVPKELPTVS